MKTIQILDDDHKLLGRVSDEYGMKMYAMLGAWGRGWAMLAPEQQAQAIRINLPDAPLASSVDTDPNTDPESEGLRMGCDVADLQVALHQYMKDKQLDANERRLLRGFLKRVVKRAENIDRATELAKAVTR
jgi:hypothetical protein